MPILLRGSARSLIIIADASTSPWPLVIVLAHAAGHQGVLGVDDPALCVDSEALGDAASSAAFPFARSASHRLAGEQRLGLRRGRRQRGLERDIAPYRLHDRLENRHRHAATGRAAAQRAALAVRIVVADPHRHGHVIREPHEPGVVLYVGGSGLAGDIWCKASYGTRGAARQHTLH